MTHLRRVFGYPVLAGLSLGGLIVACGATLDADGDGFFADDALCGSANFDCDDSDRSTGNGAVFYFDCDSDNYGDPNARYYACEEACGAEPLCGVVTNNLDCDDRADVGGEVGAGIPLYPDCDNDNYGDTSRSQLYCITKDADIPVADALGCSLVATSGDCDDTTEEISTGQLLYPDCDGDDNADCFPGPINLCPGASDVLDVTSTCAWLTSAPVGCTSREASGQGVSP